MPDTVSTIATNAPVVPDRNRETLAIVIPTKNRSRDLALAVESILRQTARVHQLLIVDQSADEESRLAVNAIHNAAPLEMRPAELCYLHETCISGLAAARNYSLTFVKASIVLFLDDDVYLESDFVQQLMSVYAHNPDAEGVSGIITNYGKPSLIARVWSSLFMCGNFHDERQPIYWNSDRLRQRGPIPVRKLGGGLMSFRLVTVSRLRFDENLYGVCDGEDVDYCAGLGPETRLLIAPGARLVHNHSPACRLQDHWVRRHVRANLFLYRKHWRHGFRNRIHFAWLAFGYAVAVLLASLKRFSLAPLQALLLGIADVHLSCRLAGNKSKS